jgi:hypothetical protein
MLGDAGNGLPAVTGAFQERGAGGANRGSDSHALATIFSMTGARPAHPKKARRPPSSDYRFDILK